MKNKKPKCGDNDCPCKTKNEEIEAEPVDEESESKCIWCLEGFIGTCTCEKIKNEEINV